MILRRLSAVVAVAMLASVLSGCVGAPAPTTSPTPTPAFASDEEAFAAAEETYRAYIDALNARLADPQSTPGPDEFLIGTALESHLDTIDQFEQLGIHLEGDTVIVHVEPIDVSESFKEVQLLACLDYSATRVIDAEGNDVTPSAREPISPLDIAMVLYSGHYLISGSSLGQEPTC